MSFSSPISPVESKTTNLSELLDRLDCDDPVPPPADATPIERLVLRTVATEAWKEIRTIEDAELIEPLCEFLSNPKLKAHQFDNGVSVLGYLLKNTSSEHGRNFLVSLYGRKNLNKRRLASLLFASTTASLEEARAKVLALLAHTDYEVLSYATTYMVHLRDREGLARIGDHICEKRLNVAQVIEIGDIGEDWVVPILEKIDKARAGSKKGDDRDCRAYAQRAISRIRGLT